MHTKSHLFPTLTGRSAVIYLLAVLLQTAAPSRPGVVIADGVITWDSPQWVTSRNVTLPFTAVSFLFFPSFSPEMVCLGLHVKQGNEGEEAESRQSCEKFCFSTTQSSIECACVCYLLGFFFNMKLRVNLRVSWDNNRLKLPFQQV